MIDKGAMAVISMFESRANLFCYQLCALASFEVSLKSDFQYSWHHGKVYHIDQELFIRDYETQSLSSSPYSL
jgi:hypothetical protein